MRFARLARREWGTAICAAWLFVVLIMTTFGTVVTPHSPVNGILSDRLLPPLSVSGDVRYLLGTDQFGRDYLSVLIVGARTSVAIGVGASVLAVLLGGVLGGVSGYVGGAVDAVVARVIDALLSFPTLLLSLLILASVGASSVAVLAVLTIAGIPLVARLARGLSFEVREAKYVEAARVLGATNRWIFVRHVVPNIFSPILVYGSVLIAVMMLAEAGLDFLGLGAQPPETSWGLLAAQGHEFINNSWWLVTFPGIAIFSTTLCINVVASRLRASRDKAAGVGGSSEP